MKRGCGWEGATADSSFPCDVRGSASLNPPSILASSPNKALVRGLVPSTAVTSSGDVKGLERELEQGFGSHRGPSTLRHTSSCVPEGYQGNGPTCGQAEGALTPPKAQGGEAPLPPRAPAEMRTLSRPQEGTV